MSRRIKLIGWAALAAVLLCAAPAAAQELPASGDVPPGAGFRWDTQETQIPYGRVVGGTAVVIGLICLGVYVVKKLDSRGVLRKGRHLDVLETRTLGRRLQLYLVRVGERVVLLAATAESVSPVAEFTRDELPDLEQADEGVEGFGAALRKLVGAGA
ncbi:MAG: flagellar biosynthetic protein FliO [Candidatus Brocadiia bacterium]